MKTFGKVICYTLAGGCLITLGFFAERIVNFFKSNGGNVNPAAPVSRDNPNNSGNPANSGTGDTYFDEASKLLELIKNAPAGMYQPKVETMKELREQMLWVYSTNVEKQITIDCPMVDEYYVAPPEEGGGEYWAPTIYDGAGFLWDENIPAEGEPLKGVRTYTDPVEVLTADAEFCNLPGYTFVREYRWNPCDAIFTYSNDNGEVILLNAYLHEHANEFLSSRWKYEGIATFELAQKLGVDLTPDLDSDNFTINIPLGLKFD